MGQAVTLASEFLQHEPPVTYGNRNQSQGLGIPQIPKPGTTVIIMLPKIRRGGGQTALSATTVLSPSGPNGRRPPCLPSWQALLVLRIDRSPRVFTASSSLLICCDACSRDSIDQSILEPCFELTSAAPTPLSCEWLAAGLAPPPPGPLPGSGPRRSGWLAVTFHSRHSPTFAMASLLPRRIMWERRHQLLLSRQQVTPRRSRTSHRSVPTSGAEFVKAEHHRRLRRLRPVEKKWTPLRAGT